MFDRQLRHLRAELGTGSHGARRDIQGLRAFAVLVVIADHLTDWPGGGFIGVDVFFVISGFLITGLLLREHERTDRISFLGFYHRRIKRILPASVLVIAATVAAGHFVFGTARFDPLKTDALWALLFSANWRFATEKTDYFNADRAISPLQHYWSLGIEEQFYFVWPWLMLGIFAVFLRRQRSKDTARVVVGAVMALVTVASFTWAVLQTESDATFAYFSTFTRVWELGLGAFLAVAAPLLTRLPVAIRPALSWVGIAGMVASLWLVDGDHGFPAPAAALPVLSAGLVIAAGTYPSRRTQQRWVWPLTNRVSNYVGDISYSLYLWHFPIIVIGGFKLGTSAVDKTVLAVAIALLSVFSYHLVENPLRRNPWSFKHAWNELANAHGYNGARRWQLGFLAFALLGAAAVSAAAMNPTEPPVTAYQALNPSGSDETPAASGSDNKMGPELTKLQTELADALDTAEWPSNLRPSMDDSIGAEMIPADVKDCGTYSHEFTPEACTWGPPDAQHTAVIVGDSIALGYTPTFAQVVTEHPGWRFIAYTTFDCSWIADELENASDAPEECNARKEAAVKAINQLKPDLLIVSNIYFLYPAAGHSTIMSEAEYVDSGRALMRRVAPSVGKIVYFASPPGLPNPADCYTPSSIPANCSGTIDQYWERRAREDRAIAEPFDGKFVDTRDWFCVDGLCPPFAGRIPIRIDKVHLTQAYQQHLLPVIRETFDEARLLR